MKSLHITEGFDPPTLGDRLEVGDRVRVGVPADEHVDHPGDGTILRVIRRSSVPTFVVRMDPQKTDLCQLPGILHVTGPKYWRKQVALAEHLTWLGEHLELDDCELKNGWRFVDHQP